MIGILKCVEGTPRSNGTENEISSRLSEDSKELGGIDRQIQEHYEDHGQVNPNKKQSKSEND